MDTVTNQTNKKNNKGLIFILVSVIVVLIGVVGLLSVEVFDREQNGLSDTTSSRGFNFDMFWQVYDLLEESYVDQSSINKEDLMHGAISGMVDALDDPYTAFFTPKEHTSFTDSLEGVYEGIGAQLGFKNDNLVIVAPLEGSPAKESGIKAGDIIVAVDGESTTGWSLSKAVQQIRGDANTVVTLTLADRKVDITRGQITIPPVTVEWTADNFAVVKVLRFGSDTITNWDRVVSDTSNNPRLEGIVLDVRNNPGGYLNAAIHLASEFFRDGVIVKKETVDEVDEFKVNHTCRLCDVPVAVLINEGSASASEILAGAIQSRSRGFLVGKQSFGKGTVQESIELSDGSAVHITSARWLLPNDVNITEEGLSPDYEVTVENPSGAFGDIENDEQILKAIELLK